ncbi:hypothetical protein MMC32_006576 [Xylographa parallela]|nr:hypothetical protein [Xylographa parallela]
MPEHSLAAGHLLAIKEALDKFPKGAHPTLAFGHISKSFPKSGVFYVDLWPIGVPFMIVTSPNLAIQATQTSKIALTRPLELQNWFRPITGGPAMFDMSVEEWKPWRALFNPAFSAANLLTQVPHMVEETLVYRKVLESHAKSGDMFQLDNTTLRFTLDLIGRSVLDTRLHAQEGYNALADALLSQIRWHKSSEEVDPMKRWHPARPFVEWYNSRVMDRYIGAEVDKRWEVYKANYGNNDFSHSKSIIDLALQAYMTNTPEAIPQLLDKHFRLIATRHIRVFLFAGHDTTSSTICYAFYLLSANPSALEQIRTEHASIFGTDLSTLPSLVSEQPHLLNQLPYTNAVLKETMRLFPGASAIRDGAPGVDLVDDDGNRYPTEGMNIWIVHPVLQRNPLYWKRPNDFLPERWLVGPEDELYPVKGAWRPFEFGARNCIGQGLVMLELKVVLALVIREYDIKAAYEDWDLLHPDKTNGITTVDGERAYQIEKGGAHPADMFPCRVSFRK